MGKNVNTKPSIDNNSISIRWLTFWPTRDNQIGAKKLKIGKDGYTPKVGKKVEPTYIIEKNNVLERYIKVDEKKLKKIPGATIKSEKNIKHLKKIISQKYSQKDSFSR
ncbi:MAG: hypothetical protein J6K42_01290 [Clostridia bacterium]|nr:hypothetical protein [Clostridia bacterium]